MNCQACDGTGRVYLSPTTTVGCEACGGTGSLFEGPEYALKPQERPETATAKQSDMRTFVLERKDDATGTSGTGVVAEGVEFSNGQVALHWLSQLEAVSVYSNIRVVEKLHGHQGRTTVRWLK